MSDPSAPPETTASGARAKNLRQRAHQKIRRNAERTLGNTVPGFCRNPFGCRAGALPWSTTAAYSLRVCKACHETERGPALLLQWDELSRSIECCPMCRWLFGIELDTQEGFHDSLVKFPTLEDIINNDHYRNGNLMEASCPLCGFIPSKTLQFMRDAHSGTEGKEIPHLVLELILAALGSNSFDFFLSVCRDIARSCVNPDEEFAEVIGQIRRISGQDIYATVVLFKKINRAVHVLCQENYLRRSNHIIFEASTL